MKESPLTTSEKDEETAKNKSFYLRTMKFIKERPRKWSEIGRFVSVEFLTFFAVDFGCGTGF